MKGEVEPMQVIIGIIILFVVAGVLISMTISNKEKVRQGGDYALGCERAAGVPGIDGAICVSTCTSDGFNTVGILSTQCRPSPSIERVLDNAKEAGKYNTCCIVDKCEEAKGEKKRENATIEDLDDPGKCVGYSKECNLKTEDDKGESTPCCCVFES